MNTGDKTGHLTTKLFLFLEIFFYTFLIFPAYSQDDPVDYSVVFGTDYEFAVNLIRQEPWMSDTLSAHGFDPDVALSIVFPELIRYSSIMDYAQLAGLEVLYVQYGAGYADFSVGWFQMKPSFAEKIEKDILLLDPEGPSSSISLIKPDTTGAVESRKARLLRLKDPYFQLLYLEAFLTFMDNTYPADAFHSEQEKLAFYATAYNAGYFKEESVIRDEMLKKRFYKGMETPGDRYSYADISVTFYRSAY
jgi:hypothetical protein